MKRILLLLLILLIGGMPVSAAKRNKKKRKGQITYTSKECINAFVTRMNANAKQFGMTNTTFKNASGWAAEGHISCASDMLRMLMAATTYDKLMHYWGWEQYSINVMGYEPREVVVKSTYKGAKAVDLGTHYDIYGGKSGSWYHGKNRGASKNLVCAVKSKVDNQWLIGCVMGAGKSGRFVAMRQLLDWLEAKRVDPTTPEPELDCKHAAATVLPLHSGMAYRDKDIVMVGKDFDTLYAPYSMTKVMTAMIALDYCKPDEIITIIEDDIVGGSGPKLQYGDKLTMEDALIALMLPSSNTLAKTISRYVGEKILRIQQEGLSR